MKRSKIILSLFIAQIFCLFGSQTVFCQAEKFDIVQYTPPKGWKKALNEGVAAFSTLDLSNGSYCIITVYTATPSAGNPQGDFTREWNRLAVQPLKAGANPNAETELIDGRTVVAGGTALDVPGTKSFAFLTVFSGFGKVVSVRAVLNDQSYLTQFREFITGMRIEKTVSAAAPELATIKSGQPGKFGSMTYSSPAGWSEQRYQNGVVFKPSDVPEGEYLAIQIMQPLNASGSLEQALQKSYDEAATMYKATKMYQAGGANYAKNDATKSFRGWEYIRGKGGVQVENGTPYKTELGLEVFVVKVDNRFERVAILESRKNCNLSRYYTSDRISYRNSIEGLLFSLQFTDLNPPGTEIGSTKGPGIVGVWQGISISVGTPSVGEPAGVRYKGFFAIFLSNGQAYFGPHFPSEGLWGLDTRIQPELHSRDWGTYTLGDGTGVLKMPYADIPLRMDGNKLIITANQTDHRFAKLNPIDGATFHGSYALSELNGKLPSVTFTSDGRFTDNGAIKVLCHEYIDCLNPALTAGSGTYGAKDYSLIFTYSGGRKVTIAFLGIDYSKNNPSPTTLMMSSNEDKLIRQ